MLPCLRLVGVSNTTLRVRPALSLSDVILADSVPLLPLVAAVYTSPACLARFLSVKDFASSLDTLPTNEPLFLALTTSPVLSGFPAPVNARAVVYTAVTISRASRAVTR